MTTLELPEKVRSLGLYQPYAGLMAHGKIETRWVRKGRKVPFPKGKYLLYATLKKYSVQEVSQISGNEYGRIFGLVSQDPESFLLTGHAMFLADLVKHIYVVPGMEKETFVDCRYNTRVKVIKAGEIKIETHQVMVGLIFENVQRIEPFPFKGKQGIGILTDADKLKIKPI